MKKTRGFILTLACICILVTSIEARAAGMKIGAMVWYGGWDSNYKNVLAFYVIPWTVANKYSMNTAPLYGPMIAFDFSKLISFSTVLGIGNQWRARAEYSDFFYNHYSRTRATILKYDLDSALTFRVHNVVRLFLGFKVQGSHFKEEVGYYYFNSPRFEKSRGTTGRLLGYGPGVGIGLTVPVYENLFLLANVSGIYQRMEIDRNHLNLGFFQHTATLVIHPTYTSNETEGVANTFGMNNSLSLAYLIASTSITISLGVRYQFLYFLVDSMRTKFNYVDTSYVSYENLIIENLAQGLLINKFTIPAYDKKYDHLYGLTFSVIYSIDFGRS